MTEYSGSENARLAAIIVRNYVTGDMRPFQGQGEGNDTQSSGPGASSFTL